VRECSLDPIRPAVARKEKVHPLGKASGKLAIQTAIPVAHAGWPVPTSNHPHLKYDWPKKAKRLRAEAKSFPQSTA
jgi:hypothetical protein